MDANSQPAGETPEHADAATSASDPTAASLSASDNAVRSHGEIGGKKFRVGLDDAYVPFRNRTRRRRRVLAVALGGLLLVGVGAYGLVNLVTAPDQTTAAACRAADEAPGSAAQLQQAAAGTAASAAAGTAPKFTLNVYNSTNRHGLAANTAAQLKQRGFVIGQVTNDPLKANVSVAAQVRGSKSQEAELHSVAAEVPGAQIQTDGRNDPSVDLVLGTAFTSLASTEQVNAALQAAAALAKASASAGAAGACAH